MLGRRPLCLCLPQAPHIGPIGFDDGEAKFSKKAVIVPASAYYELVYALHKGAESFGSGSQEKWEQTIYKHSKAHHVVCKYDYPDEEADYAIHVAIAIKWFYKNDRSFKHLVEDGVREAIDTRVDTWPLDPRGIPFPSPYHGDKTGKGTTTK